MDGHPSSEHVGGHKQERGPNGAAFPLGQAIGSVTNAAHGMTLAVDALPCHHCSADAGLSTLVRRAVSVRGISPAEEGTDRDTALAGLEAMRSWMKEPSLIMKTSGPGVTRSSIPLIARGVTMLDDGCKQSVCDDVLSILEASLQACTDDRRAVSRETHGRICQHPRPVRRGAGRMRSAIFKESCAGTTTFRDMLSPAL